MKTTNDKRFPTQTLEKVSFFMRKSSAFTLIELLVVVLIIGVLAAIAVPQYQKAVEKVRAAEMIAFVGNAKRAVEAYILKNGGIPQEEIDLIKEDILDMDLAKGMRYNPNLGNIGMFLTKYYAYEVRCGWGWCNIVAHRYDSDDAPIHMRGEIGTEGSSWEQAVYYVEGDRIGQVNCEAFAKAFGGNCESWEDMGGLYAGGGDEGGGDGGGEEEHIWAPDVANGYFADAPSALLAAIISHREQTGNLPSNFADLSASGFLESYGFNLGDNEEEYTHTFLDGNNVWVREDEYGNQIVSQMGCDPGGCNIVFDRKIDGESVIVGEFRLEFGNGGSTYDYSNGTIHVPGGEEYADLCQSIVSSFPAGVYGSDIHCEY